MDFQYQHLPSKTLDTESAPCRNCGKDLRDLPNGQAGALCPDCGWRQELERTDRSEFRIDRSVEPHEIEALLRREAVSGWRLDHTRVDESDPRRIIVRLKKGVAREFDQRVWTVAKRPTSDGSRRSVHRSPQHEEARGDHAEDVDWEAGKPHPRYLVRRRGFRDVEDNVAVYLLIAGAYILLYLAFSVLANLAG